MSLKSIEPLSALSTYQHSPPSSWDRPCCVSVGALEGGGSKEGEELTAWAKKGNSLELPRLRQSAQSPTSSDVSPSLFSHSDSELSSILKWSSGESKSLSSGCIGNDLGRRALNDKGMPGQSPLKWMSLGWMARSYSSSRQKGSLILWMTQCGLSYIPLQLAAYWFLPQSHPWQLHSIFAMCIEGG